MRKAYANRVYECESYIVDADGPLRYRIVDVLTRAVAHDAEGRGYTSEENAWKAFGWEMRARTTGRDPGAARVRNATADFWLGMHPDYALALGRWAAFMAYLAWPDECLVPVDAAGLARLFGLECPFGNKIMHYAVRQAAAAGRREAEAGL